jgi:hypothetical protein
MNTLHLQEAMSPCICLFVGWVQAIMHASRAVMLKEEGKIDVDVAI